VPINIAYHEEGWFYDLTQVRGALLALLVALASLAGLLAVYIVQPGPHTVECFRGGCANGTDLYGFLLSILAGLSSAIAVIVAAFIALDNTHRIRKLAWACATLSAATFVGFCVFIVVLSS
jgi:hypothetical protein